MERVSAALVKAQRAFGPALKSSTNPHFKSRYADLAACVEAVVEALNAAGIALMQRNLPCEDGVTVETVFVHESGETLSSGPLHVPASKQDAQGYGSALTYARRYSLMAACGIAPEDDDGNAAKAVPRAPGLPSGPIKPTEGARAFVTPERAKFLEWVAQHLIECYKNEDSDGAMAAWNNPKNFEHNEERIVVFDMLASYSKLRAYIKKHETPLTYGVPA